MNWCQFGASIALIATWVGHLELGIVAMANTPAVSVD